MKKTALALMMAAAFAPSLAYAAAGDWIVRLRATHISPDEDSNLKARNGLVPADALSDVIGPHGDLYPVNLNGELRVDSNTIPELDISYFITDNIALELILAIGSRHDVDLKKTKVEVDGEHVPALDGVLDQNLGDVNALPPTLTVQWHFNPDGMFNPYVGAGINYTRFMDKNLRHSVGGNIEVKRDSWGPALQAGLDVNLKDGWLINADVKKLWIDTDVYFHHGDGVFPRQKIDSLDIDPWVFSVGFGKKF